MNFLEQETYKDKSDWGDGPWQQEPDRAYWVDEQTGLDCLIVRGTSGALCGYVGVSEGHPFFEKDYGDVYDYEKEHDVEIEVHGGLTYSDHCREGGKICHVPQPGRPKAVWWLGFDCAHAGDVCPDLHRFSHSFFSDDQYRDIAYVVGHVEQLARQLSIVRKKEDA